MHICAVKNVHCAVRVHHHHHHHNNGISSARRPITLRTEVHYSVVKS